MSNILNDEELKRLGLGDVRLGKKKTIKIPPDVAEGRAALAADQFTLYSPEAAEPLPLGFENPWDVKLSLAKGEGVLVEYEDFDFEAVPVDEGARCRKEAELKRILVQGEGRCVFRLPDGGGFAMNLTPKAIELQQFCHFIDPVPAFEPVPVRFKALIAQLNDPLKSVLIPYARTEWSRIIAVGLILRYWPHGVAKRIPIARLLEGEVPEVVKQIHNWRNSLSAGQVKSILEYAYAACQRLEIQIYDLDAHYKLDNAWIKNFVNLCIGRDDIEGVRWLLRSEMLDRRLHALDELGWRFAVTVPPKLAPQELRLLWAAVHDPDAWWTRPVQEKKGLDVFLR